MSDVCLSVAYIGPNSRTERPRKIKIGTEVAHVTRDSDTLLGQKVKGQLVADVLNSQHARTGATWRINTKILSIWHIVAAYGTACSICIVRSTDYTPLLEAELIFPIKLA